MIDIEKLIAIDALGKTQEPKAVDMAEGVISGSDIVADTQNLMISTGLNNVKQILVCAEIDDISDLGGTYIVKAFASKCGETDLKSVSHPEDASTLNQFSGVYAVMQSGAKVGVTTIETECDLVTISSAPAARYFKAGQTYTWKAWGWDE